MKPIWIVDDDQSIRFVLEKALLRENLPTRSFTNATDVLKALADAPDSEGPQILVSDIRMPGGSGLDLLEKVRSDFDGTLALRRSCAHGVCGSDAMRVNGRNYLACKILVKTLNTAQITVEPTRKLGRETLAAIEQEIAVSGPPAEGPSIPLELLRKTLPWIDPAIAERSRDARPGAPEEKT